MKLEQIAVTLTPPLAAIAGAVPMSSEYQAVQVMLVFSLVGGYLAAALAVLRSRKPMGRGGFMLRVSIGFAFGLIGCSAALHYGYIESDKIFSVAFASGFCSAFALLIEPIIRNKLTNYSKTRTSNEQNDTDDERQ